MFINTNQYYDYSYYWTTTFLLKLHTCYGTTHTYLPTSFSVHHTVNHPACIFQSASLIISHTSISFSSPFWSTFTHQAHFQHILLFIASLAPQHHQAFLQPNNSSFHQPIGWQRNVPSKGVHKWAPKFLVPFGT